MASAEQATSKPNELVVSPRDILFECPACGKSLLVDEAGEGMIVDCPQCHINVIVPPKPQLVVESAAAPVVEPFQPVTEPDTSENADLRAQLAGLGSKLKELQTQRVEINNRMAARINDINRDIVMTARLETAHQQIVAEFNQLVAKMATSAPPSGRTRVNLRS